MLVDVTLYQHEQARCVIDTETERTARAHAHHSTRPHHGRTVPVYR
jgi:hypothetical protein